MTRNNHNDDQNFEQEYRNLQNQAMQTRERFIRKCDHKPGNGRGKVINIHSFNGFIQNKDKYSESTAYCTRCGAIFESESFQPEELNSGIYMFNSMLHQIKMLASLTDEDKANIESAFNAIGELSTVSDYYNNMVDKLAGGNKNNGGKKGRSKGHIGLDSSMMGNKSY